ncbi:MAG: nuclear transport factor 2 family protein [Nannocystaceae bacterium]
MSTTLPPPVADLIDEHVHRSHAGATSFGQLVGSLIELGVESYRVDYRRGECTYYLPSGATHRLSLAAPQAVADTFDAAAVRDAVRGAQRGEVLYPEFLRRTAAAGCVGYDVWIAGKHVVYHGRRGERQVEWFPGAGAPRAPVAVVERLYEALRRRDLPAVFELLAPDVEIEQSTELPWGGRYVGHDEARAFFARLGAALDSTVVLDHLVDAGDEVVAVGRTQGRTRAGERRYDLPIAHLWTFRGGLIARARFCIDNPTMLAALDGAG